MQQLLSSAVNKPVLAGDALLADIEAADPGDGLVVWWLGHNAFLVKSTAGRVLFDPYFSASTPSAHADNDKPHVRAMRLAIDPALLSSIDVVTSSRSHLDDLDVDTLTAVFNANPKAAFIVPEASRHAVAEQLGCDPAWPWGLHDGESVSFGEITVLAADSQTNCEAASSSESRGYVVWLGIKGVRTH